MGLDAVVAGGAELVWVELEDNGGVVGVGGKVTGGSVGLQLPLTCVG